MSDTGATFPPPPPPPAGSGGTPIPSRRLGEILTAAFESYKENIAKLLPVVAVIVVPLSFVAAILRGVAFKADDVVSVIKDPTTGVVTNVNIDSGFFAAVIGTAIVGAAVAIITAALLQAAMMRAAAQATVGDPVDVTESYKWGFRKIGAVLWISILMGLIVAGGLILLIIPGIIFAVLLSVAIPALVVENQRGTGALGRSWNLVKGHWWHVFGVIVVAGLIAGFISGVISGLGGSNWVMLWITTAIAQILTAPFSALVSVLLYVDLRAKSEGLTAERLRADITAA